MRRLAFVLPATLIIGLSAAGPAQGYWPLFHSPHHQSHHLLHRPGTAQPVQPVSVGQVLGAIQLGQQLLGPILNQNQNQNQNQTPAPEPRISRATSDAITQTGKDIDAAADNVNNLLKLVRTNDTRFDPKKQLDVPRTGAAAAATTDGKAPATDPGFNTGTKTNSPVTPSR